MTDFGSGDKPSWSHSRQARAVALLLFTWSVIALLVLGVTACGRRPTAPDVVCIMVTDTVTAYPFTTVRYKKCF